MNKSNIKSPDDLKIAVVGLGYVGTPLLARLSQFFNCKGLDASISRIQELKALSNIKITDNWQYLSDCNFFIIAAPTPVDASNKPDLKALKEICISLGKILVQGDIVVFESTVAPGTTEEICVPILEENSGLTLNEDFSVGYSPERINVGDSMHSLENVKKIISASNENALVKIANVYSKIIEAGIVKASSIKVAELCKIYENVQRDVLIALANEVSEICRMENLNIGEVTECAATKWNFSKVMPGLVGGHCIGVDTYYIIDRFNRCGMHLPLIEKARTVNESKSRIVANRILEHCKNIADKKILLLGFAYKPNTSDFRNSKVADLIYCLQNSGVDKVDCYDPLVDIEKVKDSYGIQLKAKEECEKERYDVIAEIVAHDNIDKSGFKGSKFLKWKDLF